MAGAYWAVVTDNNGSVTSRVAQLEVDPTFSKIVHGAPVTDLAGSIAATWIDYDQDGYLDLFVGNVSLDGADVPNALYHNNQNGTFSRILTTAVATARGSAFGVAWGDYDRDGDPDLFVVRHLTGTHGLYRDNGDGAFARMSDTPSAQTTGRWSGGPWGDYENDGYPDLYVGGFDLRGGAGMPGHFFHNAGDGTFTEAAVTEPQQAWCASWADYNQDGYLDLFIPNGFTDASYPYLFHNRGDGTFVRATTNQVGSLLASRALSCAAARGAGRRPHPPPGLEAPEPRSGGLRRPGPLDLAGRGRDRREPARGDGSRRSGPSASLPPSETAMRL